MSAGPTMSERASVVPLMAAVIAVCSLVIVTLGHMGGEVVDGARADVVADSVALATVGGGEMVGRTVAVANGARIVEVTDRGDRGVLVEIDHRGHRAISAARMGRRP